MDVAPKSQARPRRAWVAFLLSWLFPGLGQVYAGVPLRAAIAVGLLYGVIIPVSVLLRVGLAFSPAGVIAGLFVMLTLTLLVPIDAARVARRRREEPATRWNRIWIYAAWAIAVILLSIPVQMLWADHFWFRTSKIPSGAMMDTILVGDYVIVDRRSSSIRPVQRGDIMVFRYPKEPETLYLKRVVGLPGETVELRDGFLHIDGRRLDEPYVVEMYRRSDPNRDFGSVDVQPGNFFVLGDHRNQSSDSRMWGPVSTDLLDGRVRSIWWSYEETPRDPFGGHRSSWVTAPVRLFTRTRWERLGLSIDRVENGDAH